MTAPIVTFHPPYLRYDRPSELSQIQDRVEDLREKAYAYERQTAVALGPATLAPNIGRFQTESPPTGPATGSAPAVRRAQIFNRSNQLKTAGNAPAAENLAANVEAKVDTGGTAGPGAAGKAAFAVNVSPSGVVTMGFNCKAKFHATNNFNRKFTFWRMLFKDPVTGLFSIHGQQLGETYFPNARADEIYFEVDWGTYADTAYQAPDGTARFVIECVDVLHSEGATSDEVVLNFNAPPCIDLHSVSLNENTFIGGANGNDPTMTVVLDAPAPPGGQRIYLSLSSTKKAGILGNKFFDIPAGQTSDAISGFLGTEKVASDQSFDIQVDAGGPITGHAKVYLHKKKKK